jgi:purine-nucleoside phosphorylase
MPARLRPTAPIAADAILVGDPGRALLLAQELLVQPKMSNHARGLWGYFGRTAAGRDLTIQSTGIGGPSAALVLGDLVELGLLRAIRVGTCVAFDRSRTPGDLIVVDEAIAEGGSAGALGLDAGASVVPDGDLTDRLRRELGQSETGTRVASVDAHPAELPPRAEAGAADMQTAPLLARALALDIPAAAVLIVTERAGIEPIGEEALEEAERHAGKAAAAVLSS